MKSIYLIGFMGAGKTTIGRMLGEYLKKPVADMDEEIEKRADQSINDIFAQHGEDYFRNLETKILQDLSTEDIVITTGGGVVIRPENRQFLKQNGTVIFLFAAPEEIMKRLEEDQSRPLLKGDKKKNIEKLYTERLPLYKDTADFIIDTTGKDVQEITEEIFCCLK